MTNHVCSSCSHCSIVHWRQARGLSDKDHYHLSMTMTNILLIEDTNQSPQIMIVFNRWWSRLWSNGGSSLEKEQKSHKHLHERWNTRRGDLQTNVAKKRILLFCWEQLGKRAKIPPVSSSWLTLGQISWASLLIRVLLQQQCYEARIKRKFLQYTYLAQVTVHRRKDLPKDKSLLIKMSEPPPCNNTFFADLLVSVDSW